MEIHPGCMPHVCRWQRTHRNVQSSEACHFPEPGELALHVVAVKPGSMGRPAQHTSIFSNLGAEAARSNPDFRRQCLIFERQKQKFQHQNI
eukprot:400122-Karenia_brevis.AAC.1